MGFKKIRQKTKTKKFFHEKKKVGFANCKTGDFMLLNPKKYIGKKSKIIYRSSYELRFMYQLEANPNVLEWDYENIIIPYIFKNKGKQSRHNYIMDFQVKMISGSMFLCEVKPLSKSPLNESQINLSESHRRNAFKWKAALNWCKINNHTFKLITEKQLGIKL